MDQLNNDIDEESILEQYAKYYIKYDGKIETETIREHNNKLLNVLNVLYPMFNDKHQIRKDLLEKSIRYHDFGKNESSWLNNKKNNRNTLAVRHEVLSFLYAYEKIKDRNDLSKKEKLMILIPIVLHHNKYFLSKNGEINKLDDIDETKSSILCKEKEKEINPIIDNSIFFRLKKKVNRDKDGYIISKVKKIIENLGNIDENDANEIFYQSVLLQVCDQFASAGYDDKEIESYFKIKYKISENYKGMNPRDYQTTIIESFSDSIIKNKFSVGFINLKPSLGKTLIIENICNKAQRCPLHATPKNIISDDLSIKYLSKCLSISDTDYDEDDDSIENIRKKHKWFTGKHCALYTTPDNIFLMNQGYKRAIMFLRTLYNGIIIFDEFHDCYVDDCRRRNLYDMVNRFIFFNIPIIFMSGTTSSDFVNKIKKKCDDSERDFIYFSQKDKNTILEKINDVPYIYSSNDLSQFTNVNKGKFFFHKEERSEDIVSGFPWWDEKDFQAGYFPHIVKKIYEYISRRESTGIFLHSKAEMFRLMHYLDTKTSYKHMEDYAAVCSPRNVYKKYRPIIEEAMNELSKESYNKKIKRKYKFYIFTNYVEMGVDFSIQHYIGEVKFLFQLAQDLGRLDRWNTFSGTSTCDLFPVFTKTEDMYIRTIYDSQTLYNYLINFYYSKSGNNINDNLFTEEEIDEHFRKYIQEDKCKRDNKWSYINICGLYRSSNAKGGINSMYRDIQNVLVKSEGQEFEVARYRVSDNGELNKTTHPYLFI